MNSTTYTNSFSSLFTKYVFIVNGINNLDFEIQYISFSITSGEYIELVYKFSKI